MINSYNILISGGNGRLGKSISNYLVENGHNVVCGDISFKKINKANINLLSNKILTKLAYNINNRFIVLVF